APPRRALTVLLFARAGPDDVRVRRREGERTERVFRLTLEDGRPEGALVRGLPDAARRGPDVDRRVVGRIDLDVGDAAAGCGGTDRAEAKAVEGARLRGQDRRREYERPEKDIAAGGEGDQADRAPWRVS